jgi:hypothetical protein
LPPKPTMPPGLSSRSCKICLSSVTCREQPESRYNVWCLNLVAKDTCNINYLIFRWPYLFRSILVSLSKGWINLGLLRIIHIMIMTISKMRIKSFWLDRNFFWFWILNRVFSFSTYSINYGSHFASINIFG